LEALVAGDVDVTDLECESGRITVFVPTTEHYKAKQALAEAFGDIDFDVDEVQFIPQSTTSLGAEDQAVLDRLLDLLNYLDDVQNVYCNAA
jgi:transcriptional/translational regulatory protein YebC/TACO1